MYEASQLPAAAAALLLSPNATRQPLTDLFLSVTLALRAEGLPIDRAGCSVPMLHPEQRSTQLIWTAEAGMRAIPRTYSSVNAAIFTSSPLRRLFEGQADLIRERIHPDDPQRAYPILDELAAEGFTDYLAATTPGDHPWERAPVSWATRAPGGFNTEQIDRLLALQSLLSLVLSLYASRQSTRALLNTYLGADAASRVLDGHIRRGDMVNIEAAVCFCDLRNFTLLSDQLSQAELLDLLHDAFGAVVGAVEDERGEVLKFIGDAVLAVFRVGPEEDARTQAVSRALRAAQSAINRAQAIDTTRQAVGKSPLSIGLSVHLGPVAYGNIGGPTRLDFTVIGKAVNVASRLEGLCRVVGSPLILSDDAAQHLDEAHRAALVDAGTHALKGLPLPMRVWALPAAG